MENPTPNQDGATKDSGKKTTVSEIQITPPQSVSIKSSVPKDGIPTHISELLKNINKSGNGKK